MATYRISDNLGIQSTTLGLAIYYIPLEGMTVPVEKAELPALIARLNETAQGMGIVTEAQRLRFENKQRQDFIEELLLTLHPKSAEIMRGRLADMLAAGQQ